ncbi:hypothetical protein [Paenibacillus sp. GCM10027626]|uniref:hypothetical protein n=1 Tax=Paenibacillus sp. GCM10027626 TaxID=3273411 RepID=UPI00362E3B15
MGDEVKVVLIEKQSGGELVPIDERLWSKGMFSALEHANYLTVDGREYEMVEGRLNVDNGKLELLVVAVTYGKRL